MEKMFVYTRIGVKELTREKFRSIKPDDYKWLKPMGGLWFCEYTPERKFISQWQEWCIGEMFNHYNVVNDAVVFSISQDARIYVIDTAEDFFDLKKRYSNDPIHDRYSCHLDWYAISLDYDVVYVSAKGIKANYYNMNGWDVESGVILNFDVIENQKHISFNSNRWFGERRAVDNAPEAMRAYIYTFNAGSKIGYQSGIITAKDSYEAYDKIIQQYVGEIYSDKAWDFRQKIRNSLRIVFICEDGVFCDCF